MGAHVGNKTGATLDACAITPAVDHVLVVDSADASKLNTQKITPANLGAALAAMIWGDGSDGTATFDGSATPTGTTKISPTLYRVDRDVQYTNMTVSTGVTVRSLPNHRIFVNGTLTLNGTAAITAQDSSNQDAGNGNNAGSAGTTGASGGTPRYDDYGSRASYSGTLNSPGLWSLSTDAAVGGSDGGRGGDTGKTGNGPTVGTGSGGAGMLGGSGGTGGHGGAGVNAGAGTTAAPSQTLTTSIYGRLPQLLALFAYEIADNIKGGCGGSGGGGGGGATVTNGGAGGGGGGNAGGVILLAAYAIVLSSWTGTIWANGGNGGNGGNGVGTTTALAGCGGGGGGGGGGFITIVYHSLSGGTFTPSPATHGGVTVGGANVTANGGTHGTHGTTNTTNAADGGNGGNGFVQIVQL